VALPLYHTMVEETTERDDVVVDALNSVSVRRYHAGMIKRLLIGPTSTS